MKKKKAVKQPLVETPTDYCFWEQNDPIGKMKAAYGYDRDTWPEGPECLCPKCVGKE